MPVNCDYCQDGGRILRGYPLGDPLFGKSEPCPRCRGGTLVLRDSSVPAPSPALEFMALSRIPTLYRNVSITTWQPQGAEAPTACAAWVQSWPPPKPFLLLAGGKGLGKTHLAVGVLKAAHQRHSIWGLFWGVPELLHAYRATIDDEEDVRRERRRILDNAMRSSDLLVLDDYGMERPTDWTREVFYQVIDQRYKAQKPTVITTNANLTDDPTTDRIADLANTVSVWFEGRSRRLVGVA